jgi:septum formation protein
VLASASTSRAALLRAAGLDFDVLPARIDEAEVKRSARADAASAEDAALQLAELKAQQVSMHEPDALVIGADQILVCGDDWFDKPEGVEAAREQLMRLRGREHVLATAVACYRDGRCVWHHVAAPRLTMRSFSDAFLEAYLAAEGSEVLGSVGAYRLEGRGIHLFAKVEGEHGAILGLPMLALLDFLRQHGVLTT